MMNKQTTEQLKSELVDLRRENAELEKDIKAEYENACDFNIEHEELKHRVEVSESINSELYNMLFAHLDNWDLSETKEIDHDDIAQALEAHKLEQRAKGVELFIKSEAESLQKATWFKDSQPTLEYLYDADFGLSTCSSGVKFAENLRNQAKALKGSKTE